MTTKVTILNHGPNEIVVVRRDEFNKVKPPTNYVKVGNWHEEYVYDTQNLEIMEIKDGTKEK